MGKLSELVERDYNKEKRIIREAGGNLWLIGLGVAFILAFLCGVDWLTNNPWTKKDLYWALVVVIVFPFIIRFCERYRAATEMRHKREVRVEIKLDALLGLVNIKDFDE